MWLWSSLSSAFQRLLEAHQTARVTVWCGVCVGEEGGEGGREEGEEGRGGRWEVGGGVCVCLCLCLLCGAWVDGWVVWWQDRTTTDSDENTTVTSLIMFLLAFFLRKIDIQCRRHLLETPLKNPNGDFPIKGFLCEKQIKQNNKDFLIERFSYI